MKKIVFLFTMLLSLCVVLAGCEMGGPVAPSTYKITFDSDGGSSVVAIVAEAGAEIAAPTDPTKEGFVFAGWYLGEVKYEFSVMPDTNIELKAKWEEEKQPEPDPILYTIIFDVNGGDTLIEASITAPAGSALTLPLASKEGFNFLGWYNGEVKFEEVTMPEANITLVAKWEEIQTPEPDPVLYTLTLDVNGGNALAQTSIKAEAGAAIVLPTPTRDGYNFAGWLLDGALFNETVMPEADLTIVAKWEEIPGEKVEVTYVLNGGYTNYANFAAMVADFAIDFTAHTGRTVLEDGTNFFNISWNADGASFGYNFLTSAEYGAKWGWMLDVINAARVARGAAELTATDGQAEARGEIHNLLNLAPISDATAKYGSDYSTYAAFEKIEAAMGGAQYKAEVEAGKALLENVNKTGYTFAGWYSDEALTNKVTSVSEAATLYAKWDKVYTTLTYVLNNEDASLTSTTVDIHISDKFALEVPTYDAQNYLFNGWFLEETFATKVTDINYFTNSDLTVYGSWTSLDGYVITYNLNGGNWKYASREEMVADFLNDYNTARGKSHTADTYKELGSWSEISDASLFLFNAEYRAKWTWLTDFIADNAGSANKKAYQDFKNCKNQAELNAINSNHIYAFAYELRGFVGGIKYTKNSNYHTADYSTDDMNKGLWAAYNATAETQVLGNSGEVTLATPVREFYDFAGWYLNEDLSGSPVTSVTSTTTVYAKWVEGIQVESVTITNKVTELKRFETLQLAWELNPANPSIATVKFESSDESVATVDANGFITTINAGTVTIKIISQASGKKSDEFTMEVYEPDHFEVSYETESYVEINGNIKLLAQYNFRDGSHGTIVWESLNSDIATVNAGVVTGVKEGVATIRAKVNETIYFDFAVTVLPTSVSAALKHAINAHQSNIFTSYDLGVGAGTPVYYMDILGSVSNLFYNHEYTVDTSLVAAGTASTAHGGERTSTEFITVHYTGNMSKGADAEANAKYFATQSTNSSIHYCTGNDGIYQALELDLVGWHAGDGTSVKFEWFATGVSYNESDPQWPEWGISANAKFTINGKETSITVPYKEQRGSEGYVTDSKWLNDQGLAFKVENGQYYMGTTWWCYSNVWEGRICSKGGNLNSVGIESCVDQGSDLWYTWHVTAQLVANLMLEYNLDITRVVGHHFFAAKDCPQPLLENNMEIWWIFIDMVQAEYELLTTYKNVEFKFATVGEYDFVSENGRITEQPEFSQVVKYTVTVGGQTVTLASIVEGIYNK